MGASANDASVQRQTTAGQLTPSTRGGNTVVNVKTLKREDRWNLSVECPTHLVLFSTCRSDT
jgi:hypothetical protein